MTDFMTPAHYVLEDGSDSMDLIAKILGKEQFKGFLRGNALKYLIRYEQKGGIDDLKKALDYVKRLMVIEDFEDDRRLREDRYKYGTSVSKDRFAESLKKLFRDNKMDFRKLYVLYDCGSKKVLCASYSNLDIYAELGKSQKNDGYHGKMHIIEIDLDEVQAK